MRGIELYSGLSEKHWNHHDMDTGPAVCISPRYGNVASRITPVYVDRKRVKRVLQDSGAFCDKIELVGGEIAQSNRLPFSVALDRQMSHAFYYGYTDLVEAIVSYDLLIDETWKDGERSKVRWSVQTAEYAVEETVKAAEYLASKRAMIGRVYGHHVSLCLSAQGVDTPQYLECAEKVVDYMDVGDWFGFGGWCITGLQPTRMLPEFKKTMLAVFPMLARKGVKRVHLFGVIMPEAIACFNYMCNQYNIVGSTDSSGPTRYPIMGHWGYASWKDREYTVPPILPTCKAVDVHGNKAPTCTEGTFCRGLERSRHTLETVAWLADFPQREPDLYGAYEDVEVLVA